MVVSYVVDSPRFELWRLDEGDTFTINGAVMMKTDTRTKDGEITCVKLDSGGVYDFKTDTVISPVETDGPVVFKNRARKNEAIY